MWTDPQAPRIWRMVARPGARLSSDEYTRAVEGYDDATLARIAAEGFTGVWVFASLAELMRSSLFPELDNPRADEHCAALRSLSARAARHRIGVFLYFNDPVGLPVDHPFWREHPDFKGVTLWNCYSWCFSAPEVGRFFRDAVDSTLQRLDGIAGIFLITACESLTHCWSKVRLRQGAPPPACPRCRDRQPSEIVLEMLHAWNDARGRMPRPCRVIAWNWEWAYWYADPQAQIVEHLPEGVELLLDMELGGLRTWRGHPQPIGEYSLAYTGPSQRLLATHKLVASRGLPVHAKIQINATHELCTVPNLPVLRTVHSKLRAMTRLGLHGFLGAWSIGTALTLNTAALRLYLRDPAGGEDQRAFLEALAREHFGSVDAPGVADAWVAFSVAFEQYPFTIPMVYNGPFNDGPARRLSLRFEGKPTGRTFMPDEPGDDLARCLEGLSLNDVIAACEEMHAGWVRALADYERALCVGGDPGVPEHRKHRRDELSTARMVEVQLASALNVFVFHRERCRVMEAHGLRAPCDLPRDPALLSIMASEAANARRALPLVEADGRLGFQEEYGGFKYDSASIRAKIDAINVELVADAPRS